jgi:hypothetical protein
MHIAAVALTQQLARRRRRRRRLDRAACPTSTSKAK